MVISQPAWIGLERAWERLARFVPAPWRRAGVLPLAEVRAESVYATQCPVAGGTATEPAGQAAPWATAAGEPPDVAGVEPAAPERVSLTAAERRARTAAVRGLLLARKRCYATAQVAFAEAASLDPTLDLSRLPTFWELQRGGQETVVRAYEQTGRIRDAARLAATLRATFSPRALPGPRRPIDGMRRDDGHGQGGND